MYKLDWNASFLNIFFNFVETKTCCSKADVETFSYHYSPHIYILNIMTKL